MFYFVGIIITFFLAFLLITKKNKSKPDWILVIWLTVIGIHLTGFYSFISGQFFAHPYLLGFERPLPLLHGPLLYLYAAFSTQQRVIGKYPLLHFLPWVGTYLLLVPFLLLPPGKKLEVYQNRGAGFELESEILIWSIIVSGILYVILSLLVLRSHKRNIVQEFSDTDKVNLAWLQYLIFGIGFIWVLVIFGNDNLIFAAVVLFVIFLGYFGIRQVGIFTHHPIASTTENEPDTAIPENTAHDSPEVKKYQKSGLNDEIATEIHQKLSEVMESEKLFKNPEITLPDLSEKLEINPNALSQVINTREKKNFYDYINTWRIEDFKKMVLQPENQKYSLLGLAMQSGFNSKTSFNRNFKKATGQSPSEYLRQNNIRLE